MGGATVKINEVERVNTVLLPFIVIVYVPAVVPETLIDVAHEPELGMQFAGKNATTGPPATTGETVELKAVGTVMEASLFIASTFTVMAETTLEGIPTTICPDVGDAERAKS